MNNLAIILKRSFRRLRCQIHFMRLDPKMKQLYKGIKIDPESRIGRGEI